MNETFLVCLCKHWNFIYLKEVTILWVHFQNFGGHVLGILFHLFVGKIAYHHIINVFNINYTNSKKRILNVMTKALYW